MSLARTVLSPALRLRGSRDLLALWIREDIQERYYLTRLGPLWLVLQPLLMTLVFTIAFTVIAKIDTRGAPYPLFFIVGYVFWTYFSLGLNRSSIAITSNLRLIAHFAFPRELLVLAILGSGLVDLAVGLVIIAAMAAVYGIAPSASLLVWLPLLALQLVLMLGLGLWIATLNAVWRDLRSLLPALLRAAFYLSPVIYPVSMVPEAYRDLYLANPVAALVVGYRDALFVGRLEHPGSLVLALAVALVALVTGYLFFRRNEWRFADLL